MSKEIYISSTPHETRLAIVEKDELTEIYYERENEYTLAGSIYNGRVTRVLPGMQSSFVDIGLERDAFLYITDFMEEAGDAADFEAVTGEPAGAMNGERGGRREGGRSEGGRDRGRGRRGDGRGERPVAGESSAAAPVDEVAPLEAGAVEAGEGEVGEGAPGADGSRRWRGRRGRRRGRGGEARSVVSAGGEANGETAGDDALLDEPLYGSSDETEEFVTPPVMDTAAETVSEPRRDRGRDRDRGRGDRGGRDRDRGRGGRDRGDRPRREESGIDVNAADAGPTIEPIILPGESLSKYRGGGVSAEAPKQEHASVNTPKPSTEFSLAAGWDGGAVLPGETIRRREPSASAPTSTSDERRFESRGDRDRGGERGSGSDRRRERDSRRGGGGRDGRRDERPRREERPYVAPTPAVAPITPVMAPVAEFHEAVAYEPKTVAHEPAFEETVHEYEPGENAAASFRVDPAGASEFRQPAPVEEHGGLAVEEPEQHDVTELQPTGEMVSEVHEPAVAAESHVSVEPEVEAHGFAPGDGQLEEELLDDEEGEALELHASAFDDDTEEEETLEGAADLGSMIRDMSIDSITRSAPVEGEDEDEDDFDIDEEELEEDELAVGDDGEDDTEDELSGSEISEGEEEEFAEATAFDENGEPVVREARTTESRPRDGERRGRRDGRRGGRDRGSDRGGDRSSSDRSGERSGGSRDRRGMANSRHSGGRDRGGRSMQSTNLPAISDLLKPGQEVLVQIAKEPIAKKGARITSHIALPGRFLVFMPTVSHTGVSRKIESSTERRRLKDILLSEKGDAAGGFIVRTAASGASEEDLRSDLRFLLNMWTDIKARSESSKSPALIYHDLNLIERILRDQVTDNFSAIWVDTEAEYERVLRFLQRFQPSLIRRVKLYGKETPLFEQFGITEEINKALRSKVWLKSGGSIVINQTEALVAIDINTGKFVGKTARLEDTIVKTNLDAIPEIVRQMRLRDLGGIIIIDFIDMDERKNRNKVMAALEEELKKDRAPSKVLQFNDFGLVAITRKRVKQTLERTLSMTCGVCQGTGMTKSPVTVCNEIFIELRKTHKHMDKGDLMLRVHPEVVKQLKLNGGKWLQEMEELSGKTILLKSDPSLHPEQFDMH